MCASRVRVRVWKFRLGQSISHKHEQCPTAGRLFVPAGRSGLNVPSRRAAALAARTPTRDHSRSTANRNSEREPVWSVWRFGLRGRALRINSAFRHPSSPSETAGSRFVGFRRAGAFGHPRRSPHTDRPVSRIDGAGPGVRMRGAASSRPSRPLPRTDSGPPSRSTPPVHRLINFTTHCTAARG